MKQRVLYIMRHGEAEAYTTHTYDAERCLTQYGREQVLLVAQQLSDEIDTLLSSPYVRARQTAQIVEQAINYKKDIVFSELLTPDQPVDKTLEWVLSLDWSSALLATHQPLAGELISLLSGDSVFNVPTAGLAELSGMIEVGCAQLRWV